MVPTLALLMLGLTLIPGEVWHAPANDAVYRGFDSNLVYVSASGGTVYVSTNRIDIVEPPASKPTVNLATALLPKLASSVDVAILEDTGADQPLRIGVWSPWTLAGYFVVFGPGTTKAITVDTVEGGAAGTTLVGAETKTSALLGHYQLGTHYQVTFDVDRARGSIVGTVSGNDAVDGHFSVNSTQVPQLFPQVQLSLTASGAAGAGSGHAVLGDFRLTLPHQRWWTSAVNDPIVTTLIIGLGLLGAVAIVIALVSRVRSRPKFRGVTRLRFRWLGLAAVVVFYLAGNIWLFPLGSHPFDFGNAQFWAYVARVYGPAQLYYLPEVTSLARIWGGIPYIEASFPYEPVIAYLSTAIGWINSILFAGGGAFSVTSPQLGYVIKSVNVVFGLADALLIYLIMGAIKESRRWQVTAAAMFLFNPAVWVSASIWGQTHVISIFFVLAAILLAEKGLPAWAWLALSAAVLTRPQMIVFGIFLAIVFLRKFPWRQNLWAVSWTVIANFVIWIPLTLATSPSLPVDIMRNNFHIQEAGGNAPALTTVSEGAYSIWPLVTYLAHGASGLQRAFTPSSTLLLGSITYQLASQVVTAVAMLLVAGALLLRKWATREPGSYLPIVAVGVTAFLLLVTDVVATHFLLALPFLLLCRRWIGTLAYFYVVAIWTVSTFIPMYGELALVLSGRQYPLFEAGHNAFTNFVVWLYSSDRFITVSVTANICALLWLTLFAFRRPAKSPTMRSA